MRRHLTKLVVLFTAITLVLFLAITVFAGEEKNEADEKEISLKDAPPAVQATIEKQAAGKEIKEIEIKIKDGKEIYVVDEGTEKDFMVSSDGKFLGFEEEEESEEGEKDEKCGKGKKGEKGEEGEEEEYGLSLNQLPEKVKEAATKYLGSLESCKVKKEVENGVTIYEVVVEKESKEIKGEFTESGEIIELAKVIQPSEIPANVISKVKEKYPRAKIKEAEEKQMFENGVAKKELVYETEVILIKEFEITASGEILVEEEE